MPQIQQITVGSSDDNQPVEVGGALLTDYSGRGPNAACIIKPDIVTPGSNIWACKSIYRYRILLKYLQHGYYSALYFL